MVKMFRAAFLITTILSSGLAYAQPGTVPTSAAPITATGGTASATLAARFGLQLNVVTDGAADATGSVDATTAIQGLLTQLGTNGGGILAVPIGTYKISASLLQPANTAIVCVPGATLRMTTGWTGPLVENVNFTASSPGDHDIVVEDCTFDMTNSSNAGATHAMDFQAVRNLHVTRPVCIAGGDCVTVRRTTNSFISDFVAGTAAVPQQDACIDYFDSDTDFTVVGGICYFGNFGYGIQIAGTNQALSSAGQVTNGLILGGVYNSISSSQAAIWLSGLGTSGSGTSNVIVDGATLNMGTGAFDAIKISGQSVGNKILHVTVNGSTTQSLIEGNYGDAGGTPSYTKVIGAMFTAATSTGGPQVELQGTGSSIEDSTIEGGSFTYAIHLGGTNELASGNHLLTAGSSGMYSVTGTGDRVYDPYFVGAWTPNLTFGGSSTGITYTTDVGEYWYQGSNIFICADILLSSKGAQTGAVQIFGLPYSSFNGEPGAVPLVASNEKNITGGTTMAVLINTNSNFINLNTSIDGNAATNLQNTAFTNASQLQFCGTYRAF